MKIAVAWLLGLIFGLVVAGAYFAEEVRHGDALLNLCDAESDGYLVLLSICEDTLDTCNEGLSYCLLRGGV
jgi:hypothetical protein